MLVEPFFFFFFVNEGKQFIANVSFLICKEKLGTPISFFLSLSLFFNTVTAFLESVATETFFTMDRGSYNEFTNTAGIQGSLPKHFSKTVGLFPGVL